MKKRGPWRSASPPNRFDSANMVRVVGSVARPLFSAEAGDLLQVDHEEEEQDASPPYIVSVSEVADREVPAREQLELQHRLRCRRSCSDEDGERHDAAGQRHEVVALPQP